MGRMWMLGWVVALIAGSPILRAAQDSDGIASLRKQMDELQKGQAQIQQELEDIRRLLTPPERPTPTSVDLGFDDAPFRGDMTAKVAVIEYFDYECPFCAGFFNDTMPQILSEYVLKGKVKYIVRDFPLEEAHPRALQAAEAAHCANEQGRFWRMYDALMGNSDALDRPKLSVYAQDVGLDLPSFDKCVDSGKYAPKIREDIAGGKKLGIEGTPTFFLGVTDTSGQKIESVKRFDGAVPYSQLKDTIDKLLAAEKPTAPPAKSGSTP
jgi:protein-disulfide isomerase